MLNAALGFDTYLVMRHGARVTTPAPNPNSQRLGCYYCNDIVAPADVSCPYVPNEWTVHVAYPSPSQIVRWTRCAPSHDLVSPLSHPRLPLSCSSPSYNTQKGKSLQSMCCDPTLNGTSLHAPPPPPQTSTSVPIASDSDGSTRSVLGLVPHQLRGFLADFRTLLITGAAYDLCTGCSEAVLRAYTEGGFAMLLRAFNETGYLEALTGLDRLYDEGDRALESVEWEDEEEEE